MNDTATTPALDFVIFSVSDIEASFAFFKEVLGFAHQPDGDGPGFRQFSWGGAGGGFGLLQATADTPPAGTVALYLKAGDLAAQRDIWLARGAAVGPIVSLPFGDVFTIATPDGLTLTTMA